MQADNALTRELLHAGFGSDGGEFADAEGLFDAAALMLALGIRDTPEPDTNAQAISVESLQHSWDRHDLRRALCARAVSTLYYAVFAAFRKLIADHMVPNPGSTDALSAWSRVYRGIDHTAMERAARSIIPSSPQQSWLTDALAALDQLRVARERADYQPAWMPKLDEIHQTRLDARGAMAAIRMLAKANDLVAVLIVEVFVKRRRQDSA